MLGREKGDFEQGFSEAPFRKGAAWTSALSSPSLFKLSYPETFHKRHYTFSARVLGKIGFKPLIHQMCRNTEAGNGLADSLLYCQQPA